MGMGVALMTRRSTLLIFPQSAVTYKSRGMRAVKATAQLEPQELR